MTPPCLPLGFCWCLHLDYNDFDDLSFERMLSQQATQKLSGASSHALWWMSIFSDPCFIPLQRILHLRRPRVLLLEVMGM